MSFESVCKQIFLETWYICIRLKTLSSRCMTSEVGESAGPFKVDLDAHYHDRTSTPPSLTM